MAPNKSLQRAVDDKVHAPNRNRGVKHSGSALQDLRAAAELSRWATAASAF